MNKKYCLGFLIIVFLLFAGGLFLISGCDSPMEEGQKSSPVEFLYQDEHVRVYRVNRPGYYYYDLAIGPDGRVVKLD